MSSLNTLSISFSEHERSYGVKHEIENIMCTVHKGNLKTPNSGTEKRFVHLTDKHTTKREMFLTMKVPQNLYRNDRREEEKL